MFRPADPLAARPYFVSGAHTWQFLGYALEDLLA